MTAKRNAPESFSLNLFPKGPFYPLTSSAKCTGFARENRLAETEGSGTGLTGSQSHHHHLLIVTLGIVLPSKSVYSLGKANE